MRATLIEYQGRTQTTAEWAKEIGVSRDTLGQRLRVMSVEKALTMNPRNLTILRFAGKAQRLDEWAAELGIEYSTLLGRLARNPVEIALDPEFGSHSRATILTHDGSHLTISEWADKLGIAQSALRSRLKNHPPSVALDPEFHLNDRTSMRVARSSGGTPKTIRDWAEEADLPSGTFRSRLGNGWSVEDALTRERAGVYGVVKYKGESLTPIAWAEKLGYTPMCQESCRL